MSFFKKQIKSIRWHIQVWYGLLLLLAIIASSLIACQIIRLEKAHEIDKRLIEKMAFIGGNLRKAALSEPSLRSIMQSILSNQKPDAPTALLEPLKSGKLKIPEIIRSTFSGTDPGHYYFRIVDIDDTLVLESDNAYDDMIFLAPYPGKIEVKTGYVGQRRERTVSDESGFRITVGQDITQEINEMNQITAWVISSGIGLWIIGLIGGWTIAGYVIRPIKVISKAAIRISEDNLNERIPLENSGNELNDLASILNRTFDRLRDALQRQKQFTADASHELRTPVTVILSETQRIKKKTRSVQEYQDAIDSCHLAGIRMKKLVEGLLLLARQDGADKELQQEECQLDDLLNDIIRGSRVLARDKNIIIHSDINPVFIRTDIQKLSTVVINVLENAISHHQGHGNVWISCKSNASLIHISVKDDGPGINENDLPHIFDRFYRADKSRTTNSAHSGLGLSLSKSIMKQLDGKIDVQSQIGTGSEFVISFSPSINQ
jgi:two-component system OmpR family sensor kinase